MLVDQPPRQHWQLVIAGIGALVLIAVCGLSSYFLIVEERRGPPARSAGPIVVPTALPRDIGSRQVDPEPLTVDEVFPGRKIVISPNEPPYELLRTQAAKNCATAAGGDIADLLAELDCSQVVRATLRSPTKDYLVTAGIFNLADAAGAERAHGELKSIVDGQRGRFNGLAAGRGTDAIVLSSAHVGWHVRGHFLAYCVIAKTNGEAISDDDAFARQVLSDVIELHLRGKVLARRATTPVSPSSGPVAQQSGG